MTSAHTRYVSAALVACAISFSEVSSAYDMNETQRCLLEALTNAADQTTVGELRQFCSSRLDKDPEEQESWSGKGTEQIKESAITRRIKLEQQTRDNPFVITPHRPNYILFAAYNGSPNEAPFKEQFPNEAVALDNVEAKFQISAKFFLLKNLFKGRGDVYIAYTNRSFWQVYNELSAPFRESNHEPEIWLTLRNDWNILGLSNTLNNVGLSHQSNGRAGTLSRGWNRVYADFIFERDDFYFGIKPWLIIGNKDNNPDIDDFMGNWEFQGVCKWRHHSFGLMLRNNLDTDDNRGAVQLDWSFPLFQRLRGYVQYFNGYGESLIDYNSNTNAIGIGLQLTDWL